MSAKNRGKPKAGLKSGPVVHGGQVEKRTKRAASASQAKRDVVLIQGISEDGEALAVLRAREDRLEAGIVRSVKEGEVGQGELVRLKPRAESPLVCDVEVQVPENAVNARGGSDAHHGPAQVATRTYRANWDAIWSKRGGQDATAAKKVETGGAVRGPGRPSKKASLPN